MKASDIFITKPENWPFSQDFLFEEKPWEWLKKISEALKNFFINKPSIPDIAIPTGVHIEGQVYIHPTVKLPPFAVIQGPAYIGPFCEIRPSAYIRGNVIVGSHCILGNSCEYKNSILFDYVQTPHYNYVGDSILGYRAHLGAGSILSNVRFDKLEICTRNLEKQKFLTGLKKMCACLGDAVEVGCNAVVLPGSILYPESAIYPCCRFGGTLATKNIFKG